MSEHVPEQHEEPAEEEHAPPDLLDVNATLAGRLATEEPLRIPAPSSVLTDADKKRWWFCSRIAEAISRANEPSGEPDFGFCWNFTRELYASKIPLGSVEELPDGMLAEMGLTREQVAAALRESEA